jgi:hypothetical protein
MRRSGRLGYRRAVERSTAPRGSGRSVADRARMRWRMATRSRRVLPDFLVLGGQRCGSTTLFTMLSGHPQVLPSSHKEPHFFDNNVVRGEAFYRRLFPLGVHMRLHARRAGRAVTGEGTTYYLAHPAVPERVAAMLPDARLIAILRDPVDRAYSHYQLSVRAGRERLSFEEALAAEPERLAGEEERLLAEPGYRSDAHRFHSYRVRGVYIDQLERWWAAVLRERLLVLRSEDMFADPGAVYRRVAAFLGLDADDRRTFEARNQVAYHGMEDETRQSLRGFFREPNTRLERALGAELGWQ